MIEGDDSLPDPDDGFYRRYLETCRQLGVEPVLQERVRDKRLGNTSCRDARYQLGVVAGVQRCGSNSPMRLAGWVGSRSRTSLRYR